MAIEVLLYHSGMTGAPSATLAASAALTDLFDACLVNGFNSRSITGITRSGTVATATVDGANPFQIGEVIEISGAGQAEYNGRFRVTARDTSTVSFEVTGAPITPATGTIAAKHPAAGWTRQEFSPGNVGYRSATTGGGLGHYMQIEDANPYADASVTARTRMAVGLTGLDTATQLNEQIKIAKATGWVLIADAKTCYLIMGAAQSFMFGQLESYVPADGYAWFQSRGDNANATSVVVNGISQVNVGRTFPFIGKYSSSTLANQSAHFMRDVTQLGSGVNGSASFFLTTNGNATYTTMEQRGYSYPSAADGSIPVVPVWMAEYGTGSDTIRGVLRGAYFTLGRLPGPSFSNNVALLDDVTVGGDVRKLAVCQMGTLTSCQIAFDLGDTWG